MTDVDDHSRYRFYARIAAPATARPVSVAPAFALEQHGAPNEILTDDGKASHGCVDMGAANSTPGYPAGAGVSTTGDH